jgi:hypothetical protein
MKVSVGQIYIQAEVDFPFSFEMQSWISKELSALASPGPAFLKSYGKGFELIIRLSAKTKIGENEIRGPSVFKKNKDVEYTVFLPFDPIRDAGAGSRRLAAEKFVDGVAAVFAKAGILAPKLSERRATLINKLVTDDEMLDAPWPAQG